MLAEGESKYGFTLVAVEAAKRRVVVQQCGVKKYVRINSTPELIPTNDPEAKTAAPGRHSIPLQASDKAAVAAYLASDDAARILAGNPRLPVAVVPGAVNGSNSGHGTSTGQNDAGPDVASPPGGSGTSSSSGNQGVNTGITGGIRLEQRVPVRTILKINFGFKNLPALSKVGSRRGIKY